MPNLPQGTVTFLFTDIKGSTRLLQHLGDRYPAVLADHHRLLREAFQQVGGCELEERGDSFFVAFARATDAVAAAAAAQRALLNHAWPEGGVVQVRMGLHTGEPTLTPAGYVGLDVHRAARISAAGHGGQILLSQTTRDLVQHDLPLGASLRDLGPHRLKDLQHPEHLCQLVLPELPADFPPLKSLEAHRQNLPVQLTPFLGREQELAAVRERLLHEEVRLLTLTGPGGTGKTRLGLQAVADLIHAFEDGVFFVELAPISDPGLVASAIAHALGVRENQGQPLLESLRDYLREKALLLVLDNFEQVLEAAPVVLELLTAAPRLKVLVTSRAPLHLRGEKEFPVLPLGLPDRVNLPPAERLSQYAAVALFIQRAQDVRPEFDVTNENAPAVAEICYRLDGLPLAIELAAARMKLFTPEALLARLENRLKLLTGGARDLPARQQTLRGAIAWSYDLLEDAEKQLFRRLSVFVGGCTLEAAEAVCNLAGDLEIDLLDGIASLMSKSLLRQEEKAAGEPRFWMLETIREYALECLATSGEAEQLRHQHARFFLKFVEAIEPRLKELNPWVWLDQLELENDNLRAALAFSLATDPEETAARLAAALPEFWQVRGYLSEGRRWLDDALAKSQRCSDPLRAKLLNAAGAVARSQPDYLSARDFYQQALTLYRALHDHARVVESLHGLGWVAWFLGEAASARGYMEEALTLSRETGDNRGAARSLTNLGKMHDISGQPATARAQLDEGLALFRQLADQRGIAEVQHSRANVAFNVHDFSTARALWEQNLALHRQLGDKEGIAGVLNDLGDTARAQGDYIAAHRFYEESRGLFRELRSKLGVITTLQGQGLTACAQRDFASARQYHEEQLAVAHDIGDRAWVSFTLGHLGSVALEEREYGVARSLFEAALEIGRDLSKRYHVTRFLTKLGRATCEQGDYPTAIDFAQESLALNREMDDRRGMASSLDLLGRIAWYQEQYPQARQFFEESQSLWREIETRGGIAGTLRDQGRVCRSQGDWSAAGRFFEQSLAIAQEAAIDEDVAYAACNLATVSLTSGDPERALALATQSLATMQQRNNGDGVAYALETLASIASSGGDFLRAAHLYAAAAALREKWRTPLPPPERPLLVRQLDALKDALGEEAFSRAWAEGQAMPLEEANQIAAVVKGPEAADA
jgi:predicted ATPase/class 3 adenylate cyclase